MKYSISIVFDVHKDSIRATAFCSEIGEVKCRQPDETKAEQEHKT